MNGLPKKQKTGEYYALIAMLSATAIWGIAPPIIKYTMEYIPPMAFLFYRFLIVCLILMPFVYLELRRQNLLVKDFLGLAISGILGQGCLILLFFGLEYTSSLEVAVIGIISPLLMVVAGHYYFSEKISKYVQVGLVLICLGTAILALGPILSSGVSSSAGLSKVFGNFLIILYNLAWVGHVLWTKRIRGENSSKIDTVARFFKLPVPRRRYSSQLITALSFYIGLLLIIPFYMLEANGVFGGKSFNILDLSTSGWIGLLYMSILSSIVAYGLFEWSLKFLKVTDTVIFSYISPLFTLPAAFFILGELPTSDLLLGAGIIATGIAVAEKKKG